MAVLQVRPLRAGEAGDRGRPRGAPRVGPAALDGPFRLHEGTAFRRGDPAPPRRGRRRAHPRARRARRRRLAASALPQPRRPLRAQGRGVPRRRGRDDGGGQDPARVLHAHPRPRGPRRRDGDLPCGRAGRDGPLQRPAVQRRWRRHPEIDRRRGACRRGCADRRVRGRDAGPLGRRRHRPGGGRPLLRRRAGPSRLEGRRREGRGRHPARGRRRGPHAADALRPPTCRSSPRTPRPSCRSRRA